jgi:hypothetical protein
VPRFINKDPRIKRVVKDNRKANPDSKVLRDLRRMVKRENKKG